jgi:hypothetical protein
MPTNLTQLLSNEEARDFELGAKRDPFAWYEVQIVPNVESVTRETNILMLIARERDWEMPGWEDITVQSIIDYFVYLCKVRVSSCWNETFPGQYVLRPPSVGTRKNVPMPATWLAYFSAIGNILNRTENYGLRPVMEGIDWPSNGRQIRLDEYNVHQRVVDFFYTCEAKRILPIVRGMPRDVEGVSHVMHMQYVDDYFKSHQPDSTPNAAWVAGYLVRNRLDRFEPFVKYFTQDDHAYHAERIATREYRKNASQSQAGRPRGRPNTPPTSEVPSAMNPPTGSATGDHGPEPEGSSDAAAT